jgi:hypothetical protein
MVFSNEGVRPWRVGTAYRVVGAGGRLGGHGRHRGEGSKGHGVLELAFVVHSNTIYQGADLLSNDGDGSLVVLCLGPTGSWLLRR